MANPLEEIALKKAQKAKEAEEKKVRDLAKKVANETLNGVKSLTDDNRRYLEGIITGLAKSVAEVVASGNVEMGKGMSFKFQELTGAIRELKPKEDKDLKELATTVGKALASFESTIKALEFSPHIEFTGATSEELKAQVDVILAALPKEAKDSVKIEYEIQTADKYINVRLTDGINFYKALGGGGGGGSAGPTVKLDDDTFAVPVVNPDGTPIGGGSAGPIEIDNFPTEYPLPDDQLNALMPYIPEDKNLVTLIDDTTTAGVTYIGYAVPTGSAIPTSGAVWRIKKIDESTGVTSIKWADGDTLFNNIWNNRVSLTYN